MKYRHNKTGNIYRILMYAKDFTNSRDGTMVVVYCRNDETPGIFVREREEFEQRFTAIDGELLGEIEAMKEAIAERDKALSDILDGQYWYDIQGMTGLSKERCKEICSMMTYRNIK